MTGQFLFDVFLPFLGWAGLVVGFVVVCLIVRTVWRWVRSAGVKRQARRIIR